MTLRRDTKRKQLLDLEETKRCSALNQKVLDRTLWRSCFGRRYGPVVRQTTYRMNEQMINECMNGNKLMYKVSYEIDRTHLLCYTLYKGNNKSFNTHLHCFSC